MQRPWSWLSLALFVGCQAQTPSTPTAESGPQPLPAVSQALQLLEDGHLDQGLELLNAEIEKHPQEGRLYGARATLHHRAGLLSEALADLDRAIESAPEDPQLRNNRGFVRLALHQFDDAEADLEQALTLDPQFASALNNRGLVSLARVKYRDAVEWFSQAIAQQPDYVDALNNRGFAWMQLGRLENAYADLNQALRVSPKYVNALHNRGLLKARAGELEPAILDFTEAMMLDPLNPRYYEHRSEVYALLNKSQEAHADQRTFEWLTRLQELNRQIAAQPRSAPAWYARAMHYWNHEDASHAKSDVAKSLELQPQYGPALILQGKLALADQRYEEALQIAAAALDTDETQAAWSIRGDACLALGQYDEALECFTNAKRFDSSVAEIYYRKSQELAAQGQTEEADKILKQAQVLDPDVEKRLR